MIHTLLSSPLHQITDAQSQIPFICHFISYEGIWIPTAEKTTTTNYFSFPSCLFLIEPLQQSRLRTLALVCLLNYPSALTNNGPLSASGPEHRPSIHFAGVIEELVTSLQASLLLLSYAEGLNVDQVICYHSVKLTHCHILY